MPAILILNASAGSLDSEKDAATPAAIAACFRETGVPVECHAPGPDQLEATLLAAVRQRPDAIFIGGGDGSVSIAAHHLAGSDIPLGVLPLGTLNHFAHDLGVPSGWREAVAALAHGTPRSVDLGEVNGRTFINNCSIGSYADAVRKRDALRRLRGFGKWWAMTVATIAVFRRLRRIRLKIQTSETTFPLRTPFLVVANNRYSGHVLDRNLRARLDEGQLWIYTTRAKRHGDILRFAWQSLLRKIDDVDGLEKSAVTEAVVDYEYGQLPVALDGELVELRAPLRFRARPGALRVLAPPPQPSPTRPPFELALPDVASMPRAQG